MKRRLPKCNNRRRSSYSRRTRRSDTRRLLDVREQEARAVEDYEGDMEDEWTNYGINRCYAEEKWNS